ncbi:MAG: class I SAM-dependent methyltransferase [Patescibacteria group bacterium]|jgi:SAM-dependent methyltransferase
MYVVLLIILILIASTAYAANQGAPWVPTKKKDIERFLNFVEMKPGEKFYDLGCGDARLSVAAAKRFGVKAIGVELSIPQIIVAIVRNWLAKTDVKIKWANLYKVDLSDADIVYLFLMPEPYAKIKPKLERELKPGARVVAYVWPIVGWEADKVDDVEGKLKMYLYRR